MRFSESIKLVTPVCMLFSWSLSRFKDNAKTSEPILLKLGSRTTKIDQNFWSETFVSPNGFSACLSKTDYTLPET